VHSIRGAIRWLVLVHRPNPWNMLPSAIVSVLLLLYTCKRTLSRISFRRDGKTPMQFDPDTREWYQCPAFSVTTVDIRGPVLILFSRKMAMSVTCSTSGLLTHLDQNQQFSCRSASARVGFTLHGQSCRSRRCVRGSRSFSILLRRARVRCASPSPW
jgi:hypothetical protein